MGNGKKYQSMEDDWVPSLNFCKLIRLPNLNDNELRVSDLFEVRSTNWMLLSSNNFSRRRK